MNNYFNNLHISFEQVEGIYNQFRIQLYRVRIESITILYIFNKYNKYSDLAWHAERISSTKIILSQNLAWLIEFVQERGDGGYVFTVWYDFSLELNARIGAQLTLEVGPEHFFALGAISYTYSYNIKNTKLTVCWCHIYVEITSLAMISRAKETVIK